MKQKTILLALLTGSILFAFMGCASKSTTESTSSSAAESSSTLSDFTNNEVGMANPWTDSSAEEIESLYSHSMNLPEEAENVTYRLNKSIDLAEADFTLDGLEFCYRMQPSTEIGDISGYMVEWDNHDDCLISGLYEGQEYRASQDGETLDACNWYDADAQMTFSLSTHDSDLDGFDLTAIAEAIVEAN